MQKTPYEGLHYLLGETYSALSSGQAPPSNLMIWPAQASYLKPYSHREQIVMTTLNDASMGAPETAPETVQKKVFITGAAGFVGQYVVAAVLRAGHQVLANVRAKTNVE